MNKKLNIVIAVLFVLVGVLSMFRPASAEEMPAPVFTLLSGNATFETQSISLIKLPGATTYGNLIVPAGFPSGEKQFGGDGVLLTGLDYGYVNACFPLKGINQGWGGQVGYWDGTAWKLKPTTITTPEESSISWACAKVYENGTYALIKWIADTSLLPTYSSKPACDFTVDLVGFVVDDTPISGESYETYGNINNVAFMSDGDLSGRHVTIKYVSSSPAGSVLVNGKSSNVLLSDGLISVWFSDVFIVPTVETLEQTYYFSNRSVTYYLDFGDCAVSYTYFVGED